MIPMIFPDNEADVLGSVLGAGSLPVPLKVVEERELGSEGISGRNGQTGISFWI